VLNIAVCDRDAFICSQAEQFIRKVLKDYHISIEEFSHAAELQKDTERNIFFDIIFMEHYTNNFPYIREIQRSYQNNCRKMLLIFMSSQALSLEGAVMLVDTHPFALISKPLLEGFFIEKFKEALHAIFQDDEFFEFKSYGYMYKIPVDTILYLEKNGRTLNIATQSKLYTTYCKIEEAFTRLSDVSNSFVRIQYSCIVNKKYITKYTHSKLYIGEVEFSISNNYRQNFF
jgi:DNA-binding LytR/AlgR family response regulator